MCYPKLGILDPQFGKIYSIGYEGFPNYDTAEPQNKLPTFIGNINPNQ